jgi:hypothetical protein
VQLKPQDTLLALKYWSLNRTGQISSVRNIAASLNISAGEISKSSKRLLASHMLVERAGHLYIESGALLEWLCYGIRYAYPQESRGYGRGLATSWNCPILKSEMLPLNPAWVWAMQGGDTEGILIEPFHKSVPFAANSDDNLYRALSLLEAIRGGKPRELAIARGLLSDMLRYD